MNLHSIKHLMARWLHKQWQIISLWHLLLVPISLLFLLLVKSRLALYQCGFFKSTKLAVPVIVVGNITVGGTGKTPLIIYLARALTAKGYAVGIISRGYGGQVNAWQAVLSDSPATEVGDEPVLIAKNTLCPVFVGRQRVKVAQALLEQHPNCQVILSDDGLQHYALKRDIEIAVIDSSFGLGNQMLLPAGALREPVSRLNSVSAVVYNGEKPANQKGYAMRMIARGFYQVLDATKSCELSALQNQPLHAVAAIGNPQRFFSQLNQLGLHFSQHAFVDHHAFCEQDFAAFGEANVIMTEKDAVKCQAFARPNWWFMAIDANVEDGLLTQVLNHLE